MTDFCLNSWAFTYTMLRYSSYSCWGAEVTLSSVHVQTIGHKCLYALSKANANWPLFIPQHSHWVPRCSDKDNRLDFDTAEGHGSGSVGLTEPPTHTQHEAPYHSMGWRSENWRAQYGLGTLWETLSVAPRVMWAGKQSRKCPDGKGMTSAAHTWVTTHNVAIWTSDTRTGR